MYFFRRIKEVGDSEEQIFYKCLKCNSDLIGYKNYGKLHVACKCGNLATVYTGRNIHLIKKPKKPTKFKENKKVERASNNRNLRSDNFRKHLNSDLRTICNIISNKRDITKQIAYKQTKALLKDVDYKEGYEKVLKCLQKFCDLDSASIHLIWEPLYNQKKLTTVESDLHIVGTTYFLPQGSIVFYSVYLNPKFTSNEKSLIGTIAHELSHIYAYHNNIVFTPSDTIRGKMEYNEQMTDLLGIVLGMGELMFDDSCKNESFNTCYLTNQMIHASYKRWKSEFLS